MALPDPQPAPQAAVPQAAAPEVVAVDTTPGPDPNGLPPAGDQIVVKFGNPSPQHQITTHDPETGSVIGQRSVPHPTLKQSTTRALLWEGIDDPETVERALSTDNDRVLSMIARTLPQERRRFAIAVHELEQVVAAHTGGASPDWIESSDPELAQALGEHFGCPVGEPTMLLTNGGRDALHAQHVGTSAQPAAFTYIGLTASVTAPAATDTTLTGEITTAGGGLLRAQATYAHTAGTNTSTLTKTFTANGSDALPVTIAQIGVFNAASAGTLGYHTALNATATLNVSGDNLTVTETLTAG